jgi:hypothetical protein
MPVITHENSKLSSRADRRPAAGKLPNIVGLAHHWLASKNDDDLPIDRSVPRERQPSTVSHPSALRNAAWPSFASVAATCRQAVRAGVAMARRAYPAVIVFAVIATVLAATIAIRLAIWLPLYLGRMFLIRPVCVPNTYTRK